MAENNSSHRSFSLVLAAGGARGFAHLGVLRALEEEGLRPDAIVGVSMGAVVGVTYGLRKDWYSALLTMDTSQFPDPFYVRNEGDGTLWSWLNRARTLTKFVWDCTFGWGIGDKMPSSGMKTLKNLTRERNLEETTPPVVVCSTDLQSGSRVVHQTGSAPEAVFASASMAGVFPPKHHNDKLLVDGGYADIAPVDVARDFDPPVVVVVDPTQSLAPKNIHNGFQAILRAAEICQMRHADLRFDEADFVLQPPFKRTIDSLDFDARRECVAAGIRTVRTNRKELRELLKT